jgi:hypothetical protein
MTDTNEAHEIGTYKNIPIWLIYKENQYWLAFDSPDNQHYWIGAFNKMLEERPDHKFSVDINNGELGVSISELKPLLDEINRFIRVST